MKRQVAATSVAAILLASCGGEQSGERALGHALVACEIATSAEGEPITDESGNIPLPSSLPDGESLNIDTSPFREIKRAVDRWQALTAEAYAAAQLDPEWEELATTMGDRAAYFAGWLATRESGRRPGEVSPTISADMQRSNGLFAKYQTICDGLALRLSGS